MNAESRSGGLKKLLLPLFFLGCLRRRRIGFFFGAGGHTVASGIRHSGFFGVVHPSSSISIADRSISNRYRPAKQSRRPGMIDECRRRNSTLGSEAIYR
nr:hypothetical protein C4D60_Mb09t24630 [Ipomoea trifida]